MMATARARLGLAGEGIAPSYLERNGFTHVASNWRCRAGELDLVMRDGEILVFVEVKTRRGERVGRAEECLTLAQSARILRAVQRFIGENEDLWETVWRVDLVAITLSSRGSIDRVTHQMDVLVTG
jgi:putative endonuclease